MLCELQNGMSKCIDFVTGGKTTLRDETSIAIFALYLFSFVVIVCVFGTGILALRYLLKSALRKRSHSKRKRAELEALKAAQKKDE